MQTRLLFFLICLNVTVPNVLTPIHTQKEHGNCLQEPLVTADNIGGQSCSKPSGKSDRTMLVCQCCRSLIVELPCSNSNQFEHRERVLQRYRSRSRARSFTVAITKLSVKPWNKALVPQHVRLLSIQFDAVANRTWCVNE